MNEAPPPTVSSALPLTLSATAGYVGTAGFLALQGLFTAHVTGNFVTLGPTLATGSTGAAAKLLALPVFCAVVIAAHLAGARVRPGRGRALAWMLSAELVLLLVGGAAALALGPFRSGDTLPAI